jgi:stearoyl-CoA desaturase (delta-9 desaturase)
VLFLSVFLPTFIPWYYFGESFLTAYLVCVSARYAITLNLTWLVNSAAHLWGHKPYDK